MYGAGRAVQFTHIHTCAFIVETMLPPQVPLQKQCFTFGSIATMFPPFFSATV